MPISLKEFILRRTTALVSILLLIVLVLLTSCGDTYRPVVIPITQPGGDPQATHYALVVNSNDGQPTNLTTGVGPSVTQLDVSGDTNLGNRRTGLNPVHAAVAGSQAYVVNQGDDSLSTFFASTGNQTVNNISLEAGSGASFVAAASVIAIVAETKLNRVAIFNSSFAGIQSFINVGNSPQSIQITGNGSKAYVANTGDGTISFISVADKAVFGSPIVVGGVPTSMAMQNSGSFLFVVNSTGGAFSVIDTASNQEVQRFTGLSNPTQVIWDNNLQRVYVMESGSNSIRIYNGAAPSLALLRTVNLPATPLGLAVLDSGTKFYVMFGGSPGTVGVYSAQSFQQTATVTVQNTPVSIAAAPGSSKVYVVNQTGDAGSTSPQFPNGSISIINTSNDTVLNVAAGAAKPVFVTTL